MLKHDTTYSVNAAKDFTTGTVDLIFRMNDPMNNSEEYG